MTSPVVSTAALLAALDACPVLGIVRAGDADAAISHLVSMAEMGIQAMEVSLATPGALQAIEAAATSLVGPAASSTGPVLVGVGTVTTVEDLAAAFDAGAAFAVTPTVQDDVLDAAADRGLPVVAGALTPTEIQRACARGAAAVKLFPASLWTLRAFGDLRTVFPDVAFVPTGGVRADEVDGWLAAGAQAVGLGSALTTGQFDLRRLR